MDAGETYPSTCPLVHTLSAATAFIDSAPGRPPSSTRSDHKAIKLADITNSAAFHSILSRLDSMAPISKKRAAIDMQGYHPLMNGVNNGLTGYSSDSSNQGSSETSNSSSNNVNLNNLTSNALNLHENSHSLGLSALQSLSALGISHPAQLTSQLSALHGLGPSQMLSNLSSLSGLSAMANASSSSNSNNSVASSNGMDSMSKQYAKVNRVVLDKNSDEYRRRRERNNLAVKKCVFYFSFDCLSVLVILSDHF